MKKLSKTKIAIITIISILLANIIYILYIVFFYEDTRWNVATPPTPKQLEDYKNELKNEKTK